MFCYVFQMLVRQIGSRVWSWSSWTSQEPSPTCVSSSRSVREAQPPQTILLFLKCTKKLLSLFIKKMSHSTFLIQYDVTLVTLARSSEAQWHYSCCMKQTQTLHFWERVCVCECIFGLGFHCLHCFFVHHQGGPYHDVLHSILGAYTCYRPDVGYVSHTHTHAPSSITFCCDASTHFIHVILSLFKKTVVKPHMEISI